MNEIDLFRNYLHDVGGPAPGRTALVALRAVSGTAPTTRSSPRRRRGWLAAATVGGVALAVGLALTFTNLRQTPSATGTARVGWGMTADITLRPDPNVSPQAAVDAYMQLIRERADREDVPGVRVEQVAPDRVHLTLPSATTRSQLASFASPSDLRVFPAIASARSVEEIAAVANRAISDGARPVAYVIAKSKPKDGETPAGDFLTTQYKTAADASSHAKPGDQVIPIPDGYAFVLAERPDGEDLGLTLFKDEPVIRRSDVARIEVAGRRLVAQLTPSGATRMRDYLASEGALDDFDVAELNMAPGGIVPTYFTIVKARRAGEASISIETTGTLDQVPRLPGALVGPDTWIGPVVPAGVRIDRASRYGSAPEVVGDSVAPPRQIPEIPGTRSTAALLRVVHLTTADGDSGVWVAADGSSSMTASTIPRLGGHGSSPACPALLGPPPISLCDSGGGPAGSILAGRAADNVEFVEARRGTGEIARGAVANGWFIIPIVVHEQVDPRDFSTDRPEWRVDEIVAKDAQGNIVGHFNQDGVPITP